MLTINHTAAKVKASDALLKQLEKSLAENGEELVAQVKVWSSSCCLHAVVDERCPATRFASFICL
jgi:hypothetical protein